MKEWTWKNWHEGVEMKDLKWRVWNEGIETKELSWRLKWRTWNEWIETKDLKCMNWHDGLEMNELKWRNSIEWIEVNEMRRMNWHEGIQMTELKWMNWNEWIEVNELKQNEFRWMIWDEWLGMNELTWMTWNEWIETKEWKWMNCQKWSETLFVKNDSFWSTAWWLFCWYMKLSSRYSLVHFVDLIFQKWSGVVTFWTIFCEIKLLLKQSRAHLSTSSSKRDLASSGFYIFFVKSSSRYSSLVHILWTTFPDRGAQLRKQRPSSGDHGRPLYPKETQSFAPESVFEPEVTLPNYLMMTWMAWWCGSHHHQAAGCKNLSWFRSFLTKLPLSRYSCNQ